LGLCRRKTGQLNARWHNSTAEFCQFAVL
jgi:hypothetical protein